MLDRSAAYDKAIVARSRRQAVMAVFDLVDPDAVVQAESVSDEDPRTSQTAQVANRGPDENSGAYATLEWNRWLLDGGQDIAPDTAEEQAGQIGWVGGSLCNDDGTFDSAPFLELTCSQIELLQAVTFLFPQGEENGLPTDFTVQIYSGSALLYAESVTGNREANVILDGFAAAYPTRLRLTVQAWSTGRRRARVPRIMLGLYESWDDSVIQSVDIYSEVSFSGLALPYSTCTLTLENRNHRFDPYAPSSIFRSIEERQAITVRLGLRLEDGAMEWLPAGTYYQRNGGWSIREPTVTFELVDIIGMLSQKKFIAPSVWPTTLGGWLEAMLASLGPSFSSRVLVDTDIAQTPLTAAQEDVSGRMCGELLRYACMATQCWARQDRETGFLRVGPFRYEDGNRITADNIYDPPRMEANDDVADLTFRLDNDGEVTYPGTSTESETSLVVDNPFVHTVSDARNAYIACMREYGGKRFQVIHRGNPSSDCGDIQSVDTPFQTTISARLYKQQLALQDGLMVRMPSYLVQTPNDALFANRLVLTGSGAWTSPITGSVRVTVVGGGQGGQGGGGGVRKSSGGRFSQFDPDDTNGGQGGAGGKVLVMEMSVTLGQSYPYACGAGGSGGAGGARGRDGSHGATGTPTTFGAASSANGRSYETGVMDVQSGAVYAQKGADYAGTVNGSYGSGGAGGAQGANGVRYYYIASEDDMGYSWVDKSHPKPGEAGAPGLSGCVILEW